jgi:hypothetical protein
MSTTRFRPAELEASTGSNFLGFVECGILSVEDKADQFDWADVYLSMELSIKDSKYSQEFKIVGSYDREPNGNIKTCTLLKRLYAFFDVIGFDGGPNVQGEMVDENGESINIVDYLNRYQVTNPHDPKHEYIVYLYKEAGRKDPSKSYTVAFPRVAPNTPAGRKDLEGYINFMKSKNLIKEVQEGTTNTPAQPNGSVAEGNVPNF